MGIGNFGLTEIVAIVVLVLIFFGPKELPEIVRTLARLFRDLRRSVNEVVREFDELQRLDDEGRSGGTGRREKGPPRPGDRVLPPDAREDAGGQEESPRGASGSDGGGGDDER